MQPVRALQSTGKSKACFTWHYAFVKNSLCYAIIKNEIVLKTEIQTLLVCLLKLQDETVIKQTDSEQEALYKLRCRIISCKIAKELYVRGIKSDIVDGWKRISENKNEFIEIRNVVFDTTGDE